MSKYLPQIRLERQLAKRVKMSAKKSGRSFPAEAQWLIQFGLAGLRRK